MSKFKGSVTAISVFVMYFGIIAIFVCLAMYRLSDMEGAKRTLEVNNYTQIEVYEVGYPKAAFYGGRDDVYVTGFKAVAPNGTIVTGVVTHGFWKGSTIRLD